MVAWPNPLDLEATVPLTARVSSTMQTLGVPVIDLGIEFAGRTVREMAAGPMDSHPHRNLHKEVAGLLHEQLRSDADRQ